MRRNSRNFHILADRLDESYYLPEARSRNVLSVFNRLRQGTYVSWEDVYPPNSGLSDDQIRQHISYLYNQTDRLQGRGEQLLNFLINGGQAGNSYAVAGSSRNPWDLFVAGRTYEVKQAGSTILLGGKSSQAATNLIHALQEVCDQIISYCESIKSSGRYRRFDESVKVRLSQMLESAKSLNERAGQGRVGTGYFDDLGQLVTDVTDYDGANSSLPPITLDATLNVAGKVYSKRLDNLERNLEKVVSIKNVLFPEKNLHMLSSAELYHEIFHDFGDNFILWKKSLLKKTVKDAFSNMPENFLGIFLVDPEGVAYVPKGVVENFPFAGIARSRISLKLPTGYKK